MCPQQSKVKQKHWDVWLLYTYRVECRDGWWQGYCDTERGEERGYQQNKKLDFWLADVRRYFITSQSRNGGQLWGFALLQSTNSILVLDCKNGGNSCQKKKKEKKKKKRSEIGKWARKCTVSCWLSVASSWWSGQILRLPRHVCMLSKTGLNDVFSLPHMHLLWTLTAPQVTFKNNASFVYISNNSHFSFKLKKAKYFCMLLAEFHNQVWFVFLGPSYL